MDDDLRMIELRKEISERLEKVRGSLTDEEFTRLVDKVARTARASEKKTVNWATVVRKDK